MSTIKATIRRERRSPHVEHIQYGRLGKETYYAEIVTKEKRPRVDCLGGSDSGDYHTASIYLAACNGKSCTEVEFKGRKYQEYNIIGYMRHKYGVRVILNRTSIFEFPDPLEMDIKEVTAF